MDAAPCGTAAGDLPAPAAPEHATAARPNKGADAAGCVQSVVLGAADATAVLAAAAREQRRHAVAVFAAGEQRFMRPLLLGDAAYRASVVRGDGVDGMMAAAAAANVVV